MKTELELLSECLESGRLDDTTAEAFASMAASLEGKNLKKLSKKQREWLLGVHEKLGLDPGSENLATTGAVRVTDTDRAKLREFAASLGPKPLKPPGRRA